MIILTKWLLFFASWFLSVDRHIVSRSRDDHAKGQQQNCPAIK